MKKGKLIVAAVLLACVAVSSVKAQDVKGKNYVNAGIGIGTFGFSGTGGLPVTVSAEHGFTDKISGGLYLGMINRTYFGDMKYKYKVFGVRASYHVNELLKVESKKVDLYGGASIYYRGSTLKYNLPDVGKQKITSSAVGLGIYIGGRYMLADKVGLFGELGYGISPLQLGLTLKF